MIKRHVCGERNFEEERLWERVKEYERVYFEDMTLQPGSILDDFMWRKAENDSGS
jgi:hypothetical protein